VLVVGDAGEQPAQLHSGRQLAALLIGGTDRGGFGFGDTEHLGRMATRDGAGKLDACLRDRDQNRLGALLAANAAGSFFDRSCPHLRIFQI
jgi:hypothetical protein